MWMCLFLKNCSVNNIVSEKRSLKIFQSPRDVCHSPGLSRCQSFPHLTQSPSSHQHPEAGKDQSTSLVILKSLKYENKSIFLSVRPARCRPHWQSPSKEKESISYIVEEEVFVPFFRGGVNEEGFFL
jgi:hypothetical protein